MLIVLTCFLAVLCWFIPKQWQCLASGCSTELYHNFCFLCHCPIHYAVPAFWSAFCIPFGIVGHRLGERRIQWLLPHHLLLVYEERELHEFVYMCMLPPFAVSIRRWIELSKIQLLIEVHCGLCSCTYEEQFLSGSFFGFEDYLHFCWYFICTTKQPHIIKILWPILSLQVDPSCHDWFCSLLQLSHRNSAWSLGRFLSISPIFSSEV